MLMRKASGPKTTSVSGYPVELRTLPDTVVGTEVGRDLVPAQGAPVAHPCGQTTNTKMPVPAALL